MMKHRPFRQLLLTTSVGLLAASTTGSIASATTPPTVEQSADAPVEQPADSATWFFDDDDREINGLDRTARLDVSIPPGWAVSDPARRVVCPDRMRPV